MRWSHIWPVLLPSLLLSACSALSNLTPIGQGPLGTVTLERLASRGTTAKYGGSLNTFQATHPTTLSTSLVSRAFTGLSASGINQTGRETGQDAYPLFSQEEVEFLAPLVAAALAQAQPDQRVKFMVKDDGLTTQGTLFMHKTTLRLSLSHYRASTTKTDSRPPGLALSFSPVQALVQADMPQSWMIIEPEQPRIAIAVDVLGQLPPTPVFPAEHNAPPTAQPIQSTPVTEPGRLQQELQSTKDLVIKQAEELQKLKEELESVRRRLADKESVPSKAKSKTAPHKPSAVP